jgi:hypothetical protein
MSQLLVFSFAFDSFCVLLQPSNKQLSPQVEQLLEAEQEKLHSNMKYFVTTGLLAFFYCLHIGEQDYCPFSKSSLTHTHTQWVEVQSELLSSVILLFWIAGWLVSYQLYYVTTHAPSSYRKYHWHLREAQIEPPLIECEWDFRVQAYVQYVDTSHFGYNFKIYVDQIT